MIVEAVWNCVQECELGEIGRELRRRKMRETGSVGIFKRNMLLEQSGIRQNVYIIYALINIPHNLR